MRCPTRAVAIGVVVSAVGACGVPRTAAAPGALSAAQVTAATRRWPDASAAQLAMGREAFIARCNHCHGYPDVDAVSDARWPQVLERMGRNASLDATQTEAVLRFVRAARARPGT